ncbi:MAG: ABC transporter permease [Lachnospiraceae bacterium]
MKPSKRTDQECFLYEEKRKYWIIIVSRIFIFLGFLAIWEFASYKNYINTFFFCSPSIIVGTFFDLLTKNDLLIHLSYSIFEILVSFILIFVISFVIALLLWSNEVLAKILEPFFVTLNALPKSALAPLFIVWIGTGVKTIIVAGISVALFGSIISLYSGFIQTDPDKLLLVKTLGGSRKDMLLKVVIPSSVSNIISVLKVNIGLALVGVIIGEFFAGRRGLGYLIIYGTQVFKLDMVITSIIILCILAILLYQIVQSMERFYHKSVH